MVRQHRSDVIAEPRILQSIAKTVTIEPKTRSKTEDLRGGSRANDGGC